MDKNTVKPLEELLDSVREIDGFPIGKDEDILALSDPPFYTACPNPYIKEFIEEYGKPYDPETDDYHRDPFVGDVSEGKNDPMYNVHSYHTKVPHKAIMKYIEHYTDQGDIIFDGFCGTGMTGVAARLLDRKAILTDLSPIATFISYTCNNIVNLREFEKRADEILIEVEKECGWMLETQHVFQPVDEKESDAMYFLPEDTKGKIIYTVWSDVFVCPYCTNEYVFFDVAVDIKTGKIRDDYKCPSCLAVINKRESGRATNCFFDTRIDKEVEQSKQVPVLIKYSIGKKIFEKKPDKSDLDLIERIEESEIPYWFPTDKIPEGDKTIEPLRLGLSHVHHFYTKRNLWILSKALNIIQKTDIPLLKMWFTSSLIRTTRMYKFTLDRKMGTISGTYFIPSLYTENPALKLLKYKLRDFIKIGAPEGKKVCVQCGDSGHLSNIPENSVDYIFTDPPFGSNLMYSELNYIWESWIRVFTNNTNEAIINKTQRKDLEDYTKLMISCFKEYYRVLKPNRWITIEFHNTRASVWNAIQEAITRAGFIVAQVAVLDKKQGTYNQVTASGAVQGDLVINAYKPKSEFSERFLKSAGEGMETDFASQQLEHLPVRPNTGRTDKMLYSKMLAHYVENGFKIGYNATNFYKLLSDNFTELDGYWFMDSQVKEYNKWKSGLSLDELRENLSGQRVLFVSDEKSALTWLYHFMENPMTFGEIQNEYRQVATTTDDTIPEVKELLENNFILEDGKYRRPLSEAERTEVEKNREKELDRAFNKLLKHARDGKGKIKNVRRESLLHGFTKCYQEGRYQDILTVAEKLYKSTLESSGEIMDFIDIARIKTQGEKEVHAHE